MENDAKWMQNGRKMDAPLKITSPRPLSSKLRLKYLKLQNE